MLRKKDPQFKPGKGANCFPIEFTRVVIGRRFFRESLRIVTTTGRSFNDMSRDRGDYGITVTNGETLNWWEGGGLRKMFVLGSFFETYAVATYVHEIRSTAFGVE